MKYLFRLFALCIFLFSGQTAFAGVRVLDPWIKAAPPNAPVLALYMVVENHDGEVLNLIGAESLACKRIEMHESRVENGTARMAPRRALDIAPHGRLALVPGGLHLMMFNPKQPFKAGDRVDVRLKFSNGQSIDVEATVRAAGSDEHIPHAH
jgi:copper(I)-binding protein